MFCYFSENILSQSAARITVVYKLRLGSVTVVFDVVRWWLNTYCLWRTALTLARRLSSDRFTSKCYFISLLFSFYNRVDLWGQVMTLWWQWWCHDLQAPVTYWPYPHGLQFCFGTNSVIWYCQVCHIWETYFNICSRCRLNSSNRINHFGFFAYMSYGNQQETNLVEN